MSKIIALSRSHRLVADSQWRMFILFKAVEVPEESEAEAVGGALLVPFQV